MTKLIFMGTPDFSAAVLKGLLDDSNYDVLAVVTQPDRAVGRKKEIKMTPVKEVALAHNLPVYQPEKMSGSEEMAELMTLGADGIVTAAFGQFYQPNCLILLILRSMFMLRFFPNTVAVHQFTMQSLTEKKKLA